MGQRYDVCTPRPHKDEGKTWWHKVGTAWKNDKGLITVYLDSYPVPDPDKDNKAVMMLFEPKERGEERPAKSSSGGTTRNTSHADDEEIPF